MSNYTRAYNISVIIILILLLPVVGISAGLPSARSVAMGGAFTGMASGIEAARFNPANLGLADHQDRGVELLGIGAKVSNNALDFK